MSEYVRIYMTSWNLCKLILNYSCHLWPTLPYMAKNYDTTPFHFLTPVFSSRSLSPSKDTLMTIFCLCSPEVLTAAFSLTIASWHILSPRASGTGSIPINFALKFVPPPWNLDGSFLSGITRNMQCYLKWKMLTNLYQITFYFMYTLHRCLIVKHVYITSLFNCQT